MSTIADEIYFLIKTEVGNIGQYDDYACHLPAHSSKRRVIVKKIADMIANGDIKPTKIPLDRMCYARKILSERLRLDPRLNTNSRYFNRRAKHCRDPQLRALRKLRREFERAKDVATLKEVDQFILLREAALIVDSKTFPEELKDQMWELLKRSGQRIG